MYVIYESKVANSSQLGTVHMWSREWSNYQNQMKMMEVYIFVCSYFSADVFW